MESTQLNTELNTELDTEPLSIEEDLLLTVERLDEQVRTLQAALLTNRRIGVAIGILMKELRVSDTSAFLELRRVSMDSNRKLRDVAEDVIESGELPADLRPRASRSEVAAGVPAR